MGGYAGALTLVADEPALPYQRPPLSKAYMKGEMTEERLYFKPAAWYQDQNIEVILSTRATRIDRAHCKVELAHDDRCIRCGACVVQCPKDALYFEDQNGARIEPEAIRKFKLNLLGKRSVSTSFSSDEL